MGEFFFFTMSKNLIFHTPLPFIFTRPLARGRGPQFEKLCCTQTSSKSIQSRRSRLMRLPRRVLLLHGSIFLRIIGFLNLTFTLTTENLKPLGTWLKDLLCRFYKQIYIRRRCEQSQHLCTYRYRRRSIYMLSQRITNQTYC